MQSIRNVALGVVQLQLVANAEVTYKDENLHIPYCIVDGDDAACPLGALGSTPPAGDGARVRPFSELTSETSAELELTVEKQRAQLQANLAL